MYVLECCGLFIKRGGFTMSLNEATQYRTVKEAKAERAIGWKVRKIKVCPTCGSLTIPSGERRCEKTPSGARTTPT